MEIIPVINCVEANCVFERVSAAKEFSEWVHVDVSDARFTLGKSWSDAAAWQKIGEGISAEIHLMVEEPEKICEDWLKAGAKRLIVHLETIHETSFAEIDALVKKYGAELMVAVNPEAAAEGLRPYFDRVSKFQVLAVWPGPAGQNFLPLVLGKVKFLRRELPNATIEIDGGINLETAKLCKEAGADMLTSASYIWSSENPAASYRELCDV